MPCDAMQCNALQFMYVPFLSGTDPTGDQRAITYVQPTAQIALPDDAQCQRPCDQARSMYMIHNGSSLHVGLCWMDGDLMAMICDQSWGKQDKSLRWAQICMCMLENVR